MSIRPTVTAALRPRADRGPGSLASSSLSAIAFFRLRSRSLARGTLLVVASLAWSLALSGFPEARPAPAIVLPVGLALWGSWETSRCLCRSWSWYHSSVLLLLSSDVMALTMMLFLLIYPYAR